MDNGSKDLRTWLDPDRTWSTELQNLLKPFVGELDVYPVSKEVGKVGNNSPTFIIPLTSSENKSNIANFFTKPALKDQKLSTSSKTKDEKNDPFPIKNEPKDDRETIEHSGTEDNAPLPIPKSEAKTGIKRGLDDVPTRTSPRKVLKTTRRTGNPIDGK